MTALDLATLILGTFREDMHKEVLVDGKPIGMVRLSQGEDGASLLVIETGAL